MKKLISYLCWAFGIAWVFQVFASWMLMKQNNPVAYSALLTVTMFTPLAAVLLSRCGLKGMGWNPRILKNFKWVLAAWLLPPALSAVGAGIYYLIFPKTCDASLGYVAAMLGEEGVKLLEAQGMTLPVYCAVSVVSALTFAPFLNTFAAVGEEIGWRGAMYPILKEKLGVNRGRIVGGVIWGVWHWPIMILSGYEYGTDYWGAPISGMLLFCVFTTACGILLDLLYEKSGSIWFPALGHGAINAFASIPILFQNVEYANRMLLGPCVIGIVGGAPMLLAAVLVCLAERKREAENLV